MPVSALQFQKRFAHGFSAQAAYTWSHSIDDAQQAGASNVITFTQSNLYNGDYKADKGSSGTDQRHRAVISWICSPSPPVSRQPPSGCSTDGSYPPSPPWRPPNWTTATVSGAAFPGVSLAYTSTLNGSGGWSRVPFYPVNSYDIDRTYRVDGRLTRALPFSERVRGYLMFEAFNIFNTQYNTSLNTSAFTSSGGVVGKPVAGQAPAINRQLSRMKPTPVAVRLH